MEDNVVSLTVRLEKMEGKLVVRFPLDPSSEALLRCARGIADVKDDIVVIRIEGWLAALLRAREGDWVEISNADSRFNIENANPPPIP